MSAYLETDGAFFLRVPRSAMCCRCSREVTTDVQRRFARHRDHRGRDCIRSLQYVLPDELAAVLPKVES